MKEKKEFVEPEVVKCEEPLDEVTLCFTGSPRNDYDCNGTHHWGH